MATLNGTSGSDSILGTTAADTIYGGTGNDTIKPEAGLDTVYGGDGNDSILAGGDGNYDDIYGGAGNDSLYGTGAIGIEEDWFWGEAGNDLVDAGDGNNLVYGGTEADTIYGGGGTDSLYGDDGDDSINAGTGDDTVWGGAGKDKLDGGAGIDQLSYSDATAGVSVNLGTSVTGGWAANDTITGFENLTGSALADTLTGDGTANAIWGGDGGDSLFGGAGNDTLDGGAGDDTVYGGAGADSLIGGAGTDLLDYSDTTLGVTVNLGTSVTGGETGGDTVSGFEHLTGGSGADSLTGDGAANLVKGGAGNDTVDAGAGDDTVQGGAGSDSLIGGTGTDVLDYSDSALGVSVDLATGATGGGAAGDTISGFERVLGSAGSDTLTGDGGANALWGGDGADSLSGGAGSDTIDGGAGADTIRGGDGADSLTGGAGRDLLDYSDASSGVYVDLYSGYTSGGAAGDTISGFENLTGSSQGDTLQAGTDNNLISGGGGDDAIRARGGDDTAFGGDGRDLVQGNEGSDALSGDAGDDTLEGGTGNDTLTGGTGADLFREAASGGTDHITDFDLGLVNGATTDRLDVSALTDASGGPVKAFDVVVGSDPAGNAMLTFPGGEVLVLDGISPATVSQPGMLVKMGIPCFAAGTRIAVPGGWAAVEDLGPGDLVETAEGPRPVVWAAARRLDAADLEARPDWRPIRLRAGSFGLLRDLILSPQHGVVVAGRLIRARHLAAWGAGARVARGMRAVRYHHLLLPRHGLIRAEGAWCESFYPGAEALRALSACDLARLMAALGGPGDVAAVYGPRCLALATGREARSLLSGAPRSPQRFATIRAPVPAGISANPSRACLHPT